MPGVLAGTLLTVIPAAGDFVNMELLGPQRGKMIGNVINDQCLAVPGGYPVAAVVRDADVDRLAQAVPGQSVRIALTAPA